MSMIGSVEQKYTMQHCIFMTLSAPEMILRVVYLECVKISIMCKDNGIYISVFMSI